MQENTSLKKKAFSGFAWQFAERMCAQFVSMLVAIVLARMLTPDDYSVIGIVTIFFTFCNILITGGFNTSLIQKKDADFIDYSTILYATLVMSVLLYGVMFFCAPWISQLYNKPELILIIRVMGITFFVDSLKSVLSAYVSSTMQFRKFFYSTIIGTVLSAFIGIYLAYKGYGPWALVVQQMSNTFIDTLILFFTTRFKVLFVFSVERFKRLFSYSWKLFVASIISVIYEEIVPLIVGLKYTSSDLSYYSKGKSFPNLIGSTINSAISTVIFSVMSKLQDQKEMILETTRLYIRVSSYVIFPVMLGFFAVARSFVLLLLTDKWILTVPYIQIFCVSSMFNVVQNGNLQAIKAIGRSDISLKLEVIKKSLYLVVIVLFVMFSNNPITLAFTSIVCTMIALAVNTYPNRELIGYRYRYQFEDIVPNLLISVAMALVVYCMNSLSFAPGFLLVLQIAAGIVIYVLLSVLTKNRNFYYLLNTLNEMAGGKL